MTTRRITLFLLIVLLAAGYYAYKEFGMRQYTVKDFAEKPSLLDGATLRGGEFPGLSLKNATLRGTKFKNVDLEGLHFEDIIFVDVIFDEVDAKHATFTNVTFKDCTFINTHIGESKFANVTFHGGILTYRGDKKDYFGPTYIERSEFNNVTFDSVSFDNHRIEGISGSVSLKNLKISAEDDYGSIINGESLSLRVDNCNIRNLTCAALFNNSTLYATNSTLDGSGFVGSKSDVFYIEDCKVIGISAISGPKLLVMKNCKFDGSLDPQGTSYLVNTDFVPQESASSALIYGNEKTHMYIMGSKEPVNVRFFGGIFSLYNVELKDAKFRDPTSTINLKNVSIRGGNWKNLRLSNGQWENVRIYPTVTLDGTTFGDLRVRNVSYPDGNPWKGSGEELKQSDRPFDWPEIKVPTPQELGLVK